MAAGNDLVAHRIEVLQGVAAEILQLELEAAEAADPVHRRRLECSHDGAGNSKKLGTNARHDITGGVASAFAFVDRLKWSEDQSVVRRTAAGERKARHRKCAEYIRIGAQNLFGLPGNVCGVGKRRSRRSLYYRDEVILVLL